MNKQMTVISGSYPVMNPLFQLVRFGYQQALSCLFPVVIFASLALTQVIPLPFFYRYDWLLFICLLMQWWMVKSGRESYDELKVISLFHIIGLALELFKVHMGSWSYPEEGFLKFWVFRCIVALCMQVLRVTFVRHGEGYKFN